MITRTKTDCHVIPPPIGEIFDGGYHLERNPINGATTLVEPSRGSIHYTYKIKNIQNKNSAKPKVKIPDKKTFFHKSTGSVKKKKALSTIGESDITSASGYSGTL